VFGYPKIKKISSFEVHERQKSDRRVTEESKSQA